MCNRDGQAAPAGLLLAGGRSRRMGTDKANLVYRADSEPQWKTAARLLRQVCGEVMISLRAEQYLKEWSDGCGQLLPDPPLSKGPLTGMLNATKHASNGLLVLACDLPLLSVDILHGLISARGAADCIAYRSATDGLPEPLCALYERQFFDIWEAALKEDLRCPRKLLMQNASSVYLIDLPRDNALDNANSVEDFERIVRFLEKSE